jgi:allantoinase
VAEKHLHFRHKLSPYLGAKLQGRVESTWLRGEAVFVSDDNLTVFSDETPRGKELTRKPALP